VSPGVEISERSPSTWAVVAIVLHYGDVELTRRALASLQAQTCRERLVIICADNEPQACEPLRREGEEGRFAYLHHGHNLGFAEGCNRAAAHALERFDCDWILLLNNDAVAAPDALEHLLVAALETGASWVGPKILLYPPDACSGAQRPSSWGPVGGREPLRPATIWAAGGLLSRWRTFGRNRGAGELDEGQYDRREAQPFLSGCALLCRRSAFEHLQGFEPVFFMYQEDIDLCLRAARLGYQLIYEPRARVLHTGSATAGSELGALQSHYRWRNRLLLVDRQATGLTRWFFWWLWFPALVLRDLARYIVRGHYASVPHLVRGLLDFFRVRHSRTATAGLPRAGRRAPGSSR
jgi:GT2 family glycosyltransferase